MSNGDLKHVVEIAAQRLRHKLIDDEGFEIEIGVAYTNAILVDLRQTLKEQPEAPQIIREATALFYLALEQRFPMIDVSRTSKAYFRDRKTYEAISRALLDEHGWFDGRQPVRVVPAEYRTRKSWERAQFDRMSTSASLAEIIDYHAALPGFGSAKSIERQYLNAQKRISKAVFADLANGELIRDPLYNRLLYITVWKN